MEKNKIQDIITRSILEEASSDELMILSNWRKESPQNENLYLEYTAIWNTAANYPSIDFQSKAESAYEKHLDLLSKEESKVLYIASDNSNKPTTSQSTTSFFTLRRMTSLAALFVLALGAMVVFNTMNTTTIDAGSGITFASLEDGTAVWLDEGSSLSYWSGFGKDHRDVKLEGKAFFDVQRDESVAFNIASNDIKVSVLGTSFTVDTKENKNIVSVKTGKVAVAAKDKKVTLTADQKVAFENNDFTQLSATESDVVWRNRNLSFDNAPLTQVIADINLFHNNKFKFNNDIKNLDCPFTARSLAKTPFDDIIEILKITYDLEADNQENGDVLLTITECK